MDESKLTPIGRAFLAVVQKHWPQFLAFASIREYGELFFDYPSPLSAQATTLWISADVHLDEIIIGLTGSHSHGGP